MHMKPYKKWNHLEYFVVFFQAYTLSVKISSVKSDEIFEKFCHFNRPNFLADENC